MRMTWYNLLFAHWPCSPASLRVHVPSGLDIDTFEGQAYVGVIPFGMKAVSPRLVPPLPWFSQFLELNVRTYVRVNDQAGVYFFSLDAANPLAVAWARTFFMLPYFNALMSMSEAGGWIKYESGRQHKGASPAQFQAMYRPVGGQFRSLSGSIEEWLTERYCLFTIDRHRHIYRCDIHHLPWPLRSAEADIHENSMVAAAGLSQAVDASAKPLLHFADSLATIAWPLKRL